MEEHVFQTIKERLDKFETKIDKLAEAVLAITRIEERQAQYARSMERAFSKIDEIDNKLNSKVEGLERDISLIREKANLNQQKIGMGERVWWIVVTAVVGVAAWWFKQ